MEKLFKLKHYGTTVKTEILAGITTFFTMAYIIFVNPNILTLAGTPDNPFSPQGIFVATILASIVGTLVMGLFANVPFALAPGMGMNAFFTFTICQIMGFRWQEALAMVLICGIINIIITTTGLRKAIIRSLPKVLQGAIGAGIGLFIAYIGIKDAGFLKFTADPGTYLFLGSTPADATVIAGSGTVPSLVNFSNPAVLLGLFGVLLIIALMVKKVKGAILIGIAAVTAASFVAILCGVNPHVFFPSLSEDINSAAAFFGSISITPAAIGHSIAAIKDTAFKMDFVGLFSDPGRLLLALTAIIAFVLTDIFDALGCFVGVGRRTGIFDAEDEKLMHEGKGLNSRMDKALFADLCATITGALFGTSNTTAYAESAVGIAEGGRTGLTSVTTAALFALSLVFAPVIGFVPACATAPALIVVGILMMGSVLDIDWHNFEEAAVAFVTMALMPFAYSITTGISFGFIFFVLIRLLRGKFKEIHPIIYGATALFIANYILLAVNNI
jgi:AGZA family xanthine/uracil permease-like MFS transporter